MRPGLPDRRLRDTGLQKKDPLQTENIKNNSYSAILNQLHFNRKVMPAKRKSQIYINFSEKISILIQFRYFSRFTKKYVDF